MYKELFDDKLVNLSQTANTQEELFQNVASILLSEGFIEESYYESLIQREREYPTGLNTQFLSIALPHTDPEHIRKPFVFVVKNSKPLNFLQMGDNSEMEVKNFLFLGIKEPDKQVGLLAKIMELFMDENFVNVFKNIDNNTEMTKLFTEKI